MSTGEEREAELLAHRDDLIERGRVLVSELQLVVLVQPLQLVHPREGLVPSVLWTDAQSEVIRAIVSDYSPSCGAPAPASASADSSPAARPSSTHGRPMLVDPDGVAGALAFGIFDRNAVT